MVKKKETGLLLQINHDGTAIHVLHNLIEKEAARIRIKEMARNGVHAKYFPKRSVVEFHKAIGRLNESLKRRRQPIIKVLLQEEA